MAYRRHEGVSESLGFLLIFTMVVVGVGLVTLYGYPMLLQQQSSTGEQIMEKNMIVLQNDMKSLAYKTVPYSETSLNVGSGTLTVYNASNDAATLEIQSSGPQPVDYTFKLGSLTYDSVSAGQDIVLQDGAVLSRNLVTSGSTMLAEPRWFYDGQTNTWVINLISINSSSNLSRAGIGTVQMELGQTFYNETSGIANGQVNVYYTPDPSQDYSVAWDTYFTNPTLGLTHGVPFSLGSPPRYHYLLPFQSGLNVPPGTLVIKKIDIIVDSV